SPLLAKERLKVKFQFPYVSDCHVCPGYDWTKQDQHQTVLNQESKQHATFERRLDTTRYYMDLQWEAGGSVVEKEKHYYQLVPETDGNSFSFNVLFEDDQSAKKPSTFSETQLNSRQQWKAFWESGGAIDFSGSTDPRAK